MPIDPGSSAHRPAISETVRHALNGATMGTRYAAVFFAPSDIDTGAIGSALQASVDAIDHQMSTWNPESNLMVFNRTAPGDWVEVPDQLMAVLSAGVEIGRISGGAFDMAVGDLVTAWGFNRKDGRPDTETLDRLAGAKRRPAHEVLELDPGGKRVRKMEPAFIDLSGIAKGYGVDQLAETLEAFGIANYIVSIDGEIRASGAKPDGSPWRVAVETPKAGARDVGGVVELRDGALATSGDYRHTVEHDGKTFSHTMDSRTGRPLQNGVAAVTVRASTCMQADAWATALMVLGPDKGLELAHRNGMDALYTMHDD